MKKVFLFVCILLSLSTKSHALNYALFFDGTDDYVQVPDSNSLDLSTGLTVEAWINSNSTSGPRTIVSKWRDSAPRDHSFIFKDHNSNDKLRIELSKNDHNDLADVQGATSIITGNWIHVAATYDQNVVKLYYNGNLDSSSAPKTGGGNIKNSITDLLIGAVNLNGQGLGGEVFSGLIDEVRIWDHARTQLEIDQWKSLSLLGNETGLVAYWTFDEGSGQIVHDSSLFINHGRLGSVSVVDAQDPQWILADRSLGNVVPEPSSVLLMLSGLSGLMWKRRVRS